MKEGLGSRLHAESVSVCTSKMRDTSALVWVVLQAKVLP